MSNEKMATVTRGEMAEALEKLLQRLSVLEQAAQAQAQAQATLSQSGSDSPPAHPYGLCDDPACEMCVSQAAYISQVAMGQGHDQAVVEGRQAALREVQTALTWAGGDALTSRIMQLAQAWVDQGRPEPKQEPYFILVAE